MTGKDLLKLAKYVGAISLICGAFYTAWPRTIGDYPPMANRERVETRVEMAMMHLAAKIDEAGRAAAAAVVRGNILGAWRSCQTALYEGRTKDATDSGAQLAVLQEEYMKLVDGYFNISACP